MARAAPLDGESRPPTIPVELVRRLGIQKEYLPRARVPAPRRPARRVNEVHVGRTALGFGDLRVEFVAKPVACDQARQNLPVVLNIKLVGRPPDGALADVVTLSELGRGHLGCEGKGSGRQESGKRVRQGVAGAHIVLASRRRNGHGGICGAASKGVTTVRREPEDRSVVIDARLNA